MPMMDVFPTGECYKFKKPGDFKSPKDIGSRFYSGDVLQVLPRLIEPYREKLQLIYIDPPFMTGQMFKYRQRVGCKGVIEHKAYGDKWDKGKDEYLTFIREVFSYAHKLLAPEGSFFVHVDYRTAAYLRVMLDDIFGEKNFLNEIIWHYQSGGRAKNHFSRKHDNILFYRKSTDHFFNIEAVGIRRGSKKRNNMKKGVDEDGRIFWSIKSGGKEYRYYEDSKVYPSDVWTDIPHLHQRDPERTGYDTQKPETLLERIILSTTKPGDLVGDFFAGSGTTIVVAHRLGRRWLGVDSSPHSMNVARKRLLSSKNPEGFMFHYKDKDIIKKGARPQIDCHIDRQGDSFMGITILDYTPYREISNEGIGDLELKGLDFIDYWAFGYIEERLFYPKAFSYRAGNTLRVEPSLKIEKPIEGIPAIHIVDLWGEQFFYQL